MPGGGISIITGGGSGIGRALAKRLSSRSKPVLIVGRNLDSLLQTQEECIHPHLVQTVSADVSTEEGRQRIFNAVENNNDGDNNKNSHNSRENWVQALVHNAASIEPIGKLMDISLEEWRQHMATNVEGPLFLTKKLLPKLQPPTSSSMRCSRILHVSSGAAHHPYPGWGPYCTSKAALHMIYQLLSSELHHPSTIDNNSDNDSSSSTPQQQIHKPICVGSVRPGVVDTPMQTFLRSQDPKDMPDVSRFQLMKERNALEDPEVVARFLDWLLEETDDVEFGETEWDVRDEKWRNRWEHFE